MTRVGLCARDSGGSKSLDRVVQGHRHKGKVAEGHCKFRCGWGGFSLEETRVRAEEKPRIHCHGW